MPTTYANVELLLIGWLPSVVTARAGVATPADPASTYSWLPFVRLQRIGGASRFGLETARVNVECFAVDYGAASALSNAVRVAFETRLIGVSGSGGFVSDVETTSTPSWAPYDDTNLSRFLANYTVVIHSL